MERLQPIRGIEVIWRGVYEIDHAGHSYAVAVDYLDLAEKVRLYRDGRQIETKRSPAAFEIDDDAVIRASMGLLGMKQAELRDSGRRIPLRPSEGGAEARRAGFERRHPSAGRLIGILAWLILVAALLVELSELARLIGDRAGLESAPALRLPSPANLVLGLLALAAAVDRALRFKSSRWIG